MRTPGIGTGDDDRANGFGRHRHRRHNGNDLVSIGHDATLPAGGERDSVVAVFGSASNYGTARQDVVSVFGNTTVKGSTAGSAVAVLGDVSVDSDIGHDVVAVLGNVNLGPDAHVHGHVVSVLGTGDPGSGRHCRGGCGARPAGEFHHRRGRTQLGGPWPDGGPPAGDRQWSAMVMDIFAGPACHLRHSRTAVPGCHGTLHRDPG